VLAHAEGNIGRVAIVPDLIGTLIAFCAASRVESLLLSASDQIAAGVEERLMDEGPGS
jgi:hypothetical protein